MQKFEKGGTKSLSVENSLWKGLWTCKTTEWSMNGPEKGSSAKLPAQNSYWPGMGTDPAAPAADRNYHPLCNISLTPNWITLLFLTLKMEKICSSETLVCSDKSKRFHKRRCSDLSRCTDLKICSAVPYRPSYSSQVVNFTSVSLGNLKGSQKLQQG
jgi:hypothetical protein